MRLARIVHIVFAFAVVVIAAGIALAARPTGAGFDASGGWSARFALACSGSLMQSSSDLSGSVDCGSNIRVSLTGTFDSASGAMTLTGDFAGVPVTVDGTVSRDGTSLAGTWSAPPLVTDGPFVARRESAGSTTDLSGFWIISIQHIFSDSCTADLHQNASELSGTVSCAGGPSGAFAGTFTGTFNGGNASLSGRFGAYESLRMWVGLSDDSFYGLWVIDPSGPGGVMEGERLSGGTPPEQPTPTRTPTRTPTSPAGGLPGDANCDGQVNAIDAAVDLQVSAGLVPAAPCSDNADANGDGQLNALDAALVLQFVAGFLDHLPP